MNLSRAAKKLRELMPQETDAPKRAKAKKKAETPPAPPPAPVPVPVTVAPPPEPTPEPDAPSDDSDPTPSASPGKVWRVKTKRPRFVREKVEQPARPDRPAAPALPPRSTKFTARLLTKNLALPPKEEEPRLPR